MENGISQALEPTFDLCPTIWYSHSESVTFVVVFEVYSAVHGRKVYSVVTAGPQKSILHAT